MPKFVTRNGLETFEQDFIEDREYIARYIASYMERELRDLNRAIVFRRIESPGLTDALNISGEYAEDSFFQTQDHLVLRPETTGGSYEYAQKLLLQKPSSLPLVVWQFGKSFRREQDQPTKHVRLKEFYQLEFQLIYSDGTMADYHTAAALRAEGAIANLLPKGKTQLVASDRLPSYSEKTTDVEGQVREKDDWLELASISKRTDFEHPVVEVAIGVDRVATLRKWSHREAPLRI